MLKFLDYTLFVFHLIIIGINLFGWILPKWRKAHLIVVGLTLFSWIVLGYWKGFGYCILTDWQWDIKRDLGETRLPASFIQYLTNNVLGFAFSRSTVDIITGGSFIAAILISIKLNFFKRSKTA